MKVKSRSVPHLAHVRQLNSQNLRCRLYKHSIRELQVVAKELHTAIVAPALLALWNQPVSCFLGISLLITRPFNRWKAQTMGIEANVGDP